MSGLAKDVVDVFNAMQTQYLTSAAGVIGLNYASLKVVCKAYGVKLNRVFLELFQKLEYVILDRANTSEKDSDDGGAQPKVDWSATYKVQ